MADFHQTSHCSWCVRTKTEVLSDRPDSEYRPVGWSRLDGPASVGALLCSAQCLVAYVLNRV